MSNLIIKKTNTKSFFVKFHVNSERADNLFRAIPFYSDYANNKNFKIDVLQIMKIDNNELIVEIVKIEE